MKSLGARGALLVAAASYAVVVTPPSVRAEVLRGGVVGYGATPSAGSSGSGFVLRGTVGQPVVGASMDRSQILNHGFWCYGGSRVIAVEWPGSSQPPLPAALALGRPLPNPSRGDAEFVLALPEPAHAVVGIYDLQGRSVDRVVDRFLEAGYHRVHWRAPRGAGVYFARLLVNGARVGERRIVVVR
jgi:hypothetical protein